MTGVGTRVLPRGGTQIRREVPGSPGGTATIVPLLVPP